MQVIDIRYAPKGWENDPNFVYIGRPGRGHDGYFGNPFSLGHDTIAERIRLLTQYAEYMVNRMITDAEFATRVRQLEGKTLVCFCAPKLCHGNILAQAYDWRS